MDIKDVSTQGTSIKLPMLSSPEATLERWGTELRARLNQPTNPLWIKFAPNFVTASSMTAVLSGQDEAEYRDTDDGWIDLNMAVTVTLGGVAGIVTRIVLPIPMKGGSILLGWGQDAGGGWTPLVMIGRTANREIDIFKTNVAAFTLGATTLLFTGRYRKAEL